MKAILIYPHQLFLKHPAFKESKIIFLAESPRFFTDFNFHKSKLVLHRSSMKAYKVYLEKKSYKVHYINYNKANNIQLIKMLKKKKINELHICDPTDHKTSEQLNDICKKATIRLVTHATPAFLTPLNWANGYFKKNSYLMASFYKARRKTMNILITKNQKPIGGSWSYDKKNRKPFDKTIEYPKITTQYNNKFITEAKKYVTKNFSKNPGSFEHFFYPITHNDAKKWLQRFFRDRLKLFGDYEDAFSDNEPFLFHSILSPLLNIGLLTPEEVINKTLTYAQNHKIPINSLEGFIRQIIGWREFVRIIYEREEKKQRKSNFFKNKKKLPLSFWHATTNIPPIDTTINRVLTYGYCHHIERLMVLGNFMLLCEVNPNEVYIWFMELFIDAYDWVMIPNIYGMSQYADGGLMTTKPYVSGSNYIRKMSNYKKDEWSTIWDGLYWRFIKKHKKILSKNPRLNLALMQLKKINNKKLAEKIKNANLFLKNNFKNV